LLDLRRIEAAAFIPARITGHGTEGDRQEWVAFGDDATPAAGLGADNDTVERLVAERLMAPC